MMDESFDAFGGTGGVENGWGSGAGDQSFMGGASQAAPSKTSNYDKVPLPVTVETLNTLGASDEKLVYGNYSFSTVRLIAEVVEAIEQGDMTDVRYMVRDRGNENQTPFMVIQYFGVDGAEVNSFVEGTIIHVVGKLRSFNNRATIVAYKVMEVSQMGLADVFPKEARFAELFFTKNIPERIASGNMESFRGTMLSTEAPPSNNRTTNNANAPSTPGRVPLPTNPGLHGQTTVYGSSQVSSNRGNNAQQNRIVDFLEAHLPNHEEGLDKSTVKAGIRGDANFDKDFAALADNGVIFSTVDDDHWALIN